MKKTPWIIGSIASLALAAYGCGSSSTSGGGGSTSTATGSGGGATTSGTSTGTSTATGTSTGTGVGGATSTSTGTGTGTSTGTGTGGSGGGPDFVACNPFTAKECDTAMGQSCDFDGAAFSCFDPPNTAKLCGECGVDPGDGGPSDFCGVGLTCLDSNKCAAFCCTDTDCGANGTCDLTFLGDPKVGVCLDKMQGDSGMAQPACEMLPSPLPSGGSCYMP